MALIPSHEVYRTSSLSLNLHPKDSGPFTPEFNFFATQSLNDLEDLKRRMSENKNDPLNRLEVETTSTTSLPLSFPYYVFDDKSNSFDTFNILNNVDQEGQAKGPTFNNMSHLNHRKIGGLPVKDGNPNETSIKDPFEDDLFNPVPKRFSQFIKDQQNIPARPIESLTSDSDSMRSTSLTHRHKKSRSSGSYRNKRPSSSLPKTRSSARVNDLMSLSRQISDTMGSQATIFSTRQELEARNITTPRGTNLYSTTSRTSSTLSRKKAIRAREGGVLYRMKLRLKKWIHKLKFLKYRSFKVSSKRTGSVKRSRSKGKTLKRKYRANPQNTSVKRLLSISVPVNNPDLGKGDIQKVQTLDDAIKFQAGAPRENVRMPRQSADMKFNHLSTYIDQQQNLYLNNMDKQTGSINHGRDKKNVVFRNNSKKSRMNSEVSSVPPAVPPHIVKPRVPSINTTELWRRYLAHVVSKRIQLRQEIRFFQEILASHEFKASNYASSEAMSSSSKSVLPDDEDIMTETGTISDSAYETVTSLSEAPSETPEVESLDVQPYMDPDVEKFNEKLQNQNRRSVLGEMLDYDSSDAESTSTSASNDSRSSFQGSSVAGSNLNIDKQYSLKRTRINRSLSSMSQHNYHTSGMTRSEGIVGLSRYG